MRMMRCLTFELTPTAEAGGVSPDCDDAPSATGRAYAACRSGSGVERGVRRHWATWVHVLELDSHRPPVSRQLSCAKS